MPDQLTHDTAAHVIDALCRKATTLVNPTLKDWWPEPVTASEYKRTRAALADFLIRCDANDHPTGAVGVALAELLAEVIAATAQEQHSIALLNLMPSLRAEIERCLLHGGSVFPAAEATT